MERGDADHARLLCVGNAETRSGRELAAQRAQLHSICGQVTSVRSLNKIMMFVSLRKEGTLDESRVEVLVCEAHLADPADMLLWRHGVKRGDVLRVIGWVEGQRATEPQVVRLTCHRAEHLARWPGIWTGVEFSADTACLTRDAVVDAERLPEVALSSKRATHLRVLADTESQALSLPAAFDLSTLQQPQQAPRCSTSACLPISGRSYPFGGNGVTDEAHKLWYRGIPVHDLCKRTISRSECTKSVCTLIHTNFLEHWDGSPPPPALLSGPVRRTSQPSSGSCAEIAPTGGPCDGDAAAEITTCVAAAACDSTTHGLSSAFVAVLLSHVDGNSTSAAIGVEAEPQLQRVGHRHQLQDAKSTPPDFAELAQVWQRWRSATRTLRTLRVAGDTTSHETRVPHAGRATAFAAWLVAHFPRNVLAAGVLDVAGGRGHLAIALGGTHGITTTVVDARPRQFEKAGAPSYEYMQAWFGPQFVSDHPGIVQTVGCVVGLHPDQATEPIVDFALSHGKPFAVVPCCVFGRLAPHRRLEDGSAVSSYEDFLLYLQQKDATGGVRTAFLPYHGRNVVLYRL